MGNRAVIAFQPASDPGIGDDTIGIYLHWNGGPESVEAFLTAADELGVRSENEYGAARLCQIIGNWFGGTLSLGIGPCRTLDTDNGDNGTYIVDLENHGWKVVRHIARQDDIRDGIDSAGFGQSYRNEILVEVLEVNRPIFQPEKVAS